MLEDIIVQAKLNSITWAVGSVAVLVFGLKNYLRHRQANNYLNGYLAWFGLFLGIGLALTSWAEFFTTNIGILHAFNLASEAFIYMAFIIKSRLLWYMILKGRISYWIIFIPVLAVAVWGWVSNLYGSTTNISEMFVDFRYAYGGVVAQNILLGGVVVPIGLVFMIRGIKELISKHHFRLFLKPFFIGLAYIGIATSTISNNLESGGLETPASAYMNTFLFLIFLLVLLLPPLKKPEKSRAPSSR